MSIKAVKKITEDWYTIAGQEGEENPARFKIRSLNGVEHAAVISHLKVENGNFVLNFGGVMEAVKFGLVGWEGFEGEDGPLDFSLENLDFIPGLHIREAASAILKMCNISEDEVKKPE